MPRRLSRILLLILLVAGITLAAIYRDHVDMAALRDWVAQAGNAGPVLFIALYAIGTLVFLPGSLLTLAGGALFGPLWGSVCNLAGATIGATGAFLVSRHLAGSWVERRLGGRLRQLVDGVEQEGWRFVAFTRLVPLFPFNLLNYALGLTRIPLPHYVITSMLCMAPGAIAYTWLGYAGSEAATGGRDLVRNVGIALALLAAVVFLPRLVTRLRRKPWLEIDALKERVDAHEGLLLDVRTRADFAGEQGHIPGALNIPLEELAQRVGELGADRQQPIAIVCRTDRRSAGAADLLQRQGYTDARVVRGGMTAWLGRGWPRTGA